MVKIREKLLYLYGYVHEELINFIECNILIWSVSRNFVSMADMLIIMTNTLHAVTLLHITHIIYFILLLHSYWLTVWSCNNLDIKQKLMSLYEFQNMTHTVAPTVLTISVHHLHHSSLLNNNNRSSHVPSSPRPHNMLPDHHLNHRLQSLSQRRPRHPRQPPRVPSKSSALDLKDDSSKSEGRLTNPNSERFDSFFQ